MENFFLFIFYIFGFFMTIYFNGVCSKDCDEKSFKTTILPCSEHNTTDVFVYSTENCDISDKNKNLIHSKISDVICNTECGRGYKLDYEYDLLQASLTCKECPANMYSKGGNFVINGTMKEWTDEVLLKNKIISECFVIDHLGAILRHKTCQGFKVANDNSWISTTPTQVFEYHITSQLFLGIFLKTEGSIKLKYKKYTQKIGDNANGQLSMFIDYSLELSDTDTDYDWKIFEKKLSPGFHNFMWIYNYLNNKQGSDSANDFKLYIESIEISGVEYGSFECLDCGNAISTEGSGYCYDCHQGYYYDNSKKACVMCPDGKFSLADSIGIESCIYKQPCTIDDFEISVSKCEQKSNDPGSSYVKKISYKIIEPAICDITHPKSIKEIPDVLEECGKCSPGFYVNTNKECMPCPAGTISNASTNFKCIECPDGFQASSLYDMSKTYSGQEKEFEKFCFANNKSKDCINKKWLLSKGKFYVKSFPIQSDSIELILEKRFRIIDRVGRLVVEFALANLISREAYFVFKINHKSYLNVTNLHNTGESRSGKNLEVPLVRGEYLLSFKFSFNRKRGQAAYESLSTIIINKLEIYGSDSGWSNECIKCSLGTFRTNLSDKLNKLNSHVCELCPSGTTSNDKFTECVPCPTDQISDDERQCIQCPPFTEINTRSCQPIDIIHNEKRLLKFNMNYVRTEYQKKCEGNDEDFSHFCYNRKFIGPIMDDSTSQDSNINNYDINHVQENKYVFFMSPFESDKISLVDYIYQTEKDDLSVGHIFSLIEDKKFSTVISESGTISSKTKTEDKSKNSKKLKNVGSYIKRISLIDDSEFTLGKNITVNNGIIIEYGGGDICMNDRSKIFT